MMRCDDVRDLLAAYALDAVDVDERDRLDDHLASCPACAEELRGYRETAALLALAVPQVEPPADLGARVVAAAGRSDGEQRAERAWRRPSAGRRPSLLALVASLALLIAVGVALWAASLQGQLAEQRALAASNEERALRYDRVVAVLQSEGLIVRSLESTPVAPNGYGRVYLDPASGDGMVMVRSLPPLPEGRAYQLWIVKADGERATCGFLRRTSPDGDGYTLIQAPLPVSDWQRLGLTEEPATGSPGPTGPRVIGGPL